MNKLNKEQRRQTHLKRLSILFMAYKNDLATRLTETRKCFDRPVYAVDIHTHSMHSDGKGTVEENAWCVQNWGLDFFFATDHGSLQQKRNLKRLSHVGWGQEPGIGPHHIGLLANTRLFKPRRDSVGADFQRARRLAPFVWIPHPAGWYPGTRYTPEKIQALWQLGPAFAMEIMNGAHKIVRAYDTFDEQAVLAWDRLLCDGRKITAVAGSDAHGPYDIGTTWTGVFASRRSASSIIHALNQGRCFATEATLLEFSCNGKPMGSTLRVRPRTALSFYFRVADAFGLTSLRMVSQGRVIKELAAKNRKIVEGRFTLNAPGRPAYYRLESTAGDDRRAFSTPVYIEPIH